MFRCQSAFSQSASVLTMRSIFNGSTKFNRSITTSFDHAVVGNGILGLTVAFRLWQLSPDSKICIIGKDSRNSCASIAAGAMLGTFGEITSDTFKHREDKLYFEMSHKAQKVWPQFVDELNAETGSNAVEINENGTYIMLNNKGTSVDDTPNYECISDALKRVQEPHYRVNGYDIEGHYPEETSRAFEALYVPNERSINPLSVMDSLVTILSNSKNVTFINNNCSSIETETDNVLRGVVLDNEDKIVAKNLIVAAGVGTQNIINSVPDYKGQIPYIVCGNGVSFLVDQSNLGEKDKIKHVLRTPNRAGACGLHLVPRSINGKYSHVYIGAGNMMNLTPRVGASFESSSWILSSVLKEFSRHLAGTSIVNIFNGARPHTLDGQPIIGKSEIVDGVWFLSGTGRDGFHCSPLLSLYFAKHILKLTSDENDADYKDSKVIFDVFKPERELIQNYSQQDTIKLAEHQAYCALHETGGMLTTDLFKAFPHWLENDVKSIYQDLETDYALSPLILLPLICRNTAFNKTTIKNILKDYQKQEQKPL